MTSARPNVLGLASHREGRFEVQDEGSQLLGAAVGAGPGEAILDACAGAGGKTDTIIILGFSHYSDDGLFVLTEKDFETPLGIAETDREFVRTLRGFLRMPLPRGPRLAFITYSGAQAIMSIDTAIDEGLQLARFQDETKKSIAQVIANCPISDARRMLLRKYIDEEGQDVAGGQLGPHYDMWLKIADSLGISRELMQSFDDVLPVYRYTVDAVFNFAKHQTWLEGVAATYATEGRMWKRYTPKAEHKEEGLLGEGEAWTRHYGLPKDALLFFNVHSDANDEHGDCVEHRSCHPPDER